MNEPTDKEIQAAWDTVNEALDRVDDKRAYFNRLNRACECLAAALNAFMRDRTTPTKAPTGDQSDDDNGKPEPAGGD